MRLKPIAASILATLPMMACTAVNTIDFPLPVHSQSHLQRDAQEQVLMFSAPGEGDPGGWTEVARALDVLSRDDPGSLAAATSLLTQMCQPERRDPRTGSGAPRTFALPAFAAPLILAAIDVGVTALRQEIDRWASSYEASWSPSTYVGEFYDGPPQGGIETARFAYPCFAVVRTIDEGEGARIAFLHIGHFKASGDGIAVRIEPLIHRHAGTKARVGSGGTFNAAMIIAVQGLWVDQRRDIVTTRDTVFTATVNFGTQNLNAPRTRLYTSAQERRAGSSTWFPYVPVSIRSARAGRTPELFGSGPVNITVTVAETAAARDLAAAAARQADSLVDQLAARLRERLAEQQ